MMDALLFAADAASETRYEFVQLQYMTQWWHWLTLLAVCVAVMGYVVFVYIRDSVDLSMSLSILLAFLRWSALLAILFVFLDLEKRTQYETTRNSRVVLLVDTSQSMGLQDSDSTSVPAAPSRVDQVVEQLTEGTLLKDLRKEHDLVVLNFDEHEKPIELASYSKIVADEDPAAISAEAAAELKDSYAEVQVMLVVAGSLLGVTLILLLLFTFWRSGEVKRRPAWAMLVAVVMLIVAVVTLAITSLRNPKIDMLVAAQNKPLKAPKEETVEQPAAESKAPKVIDWKEALLPRGTETRMGDAIVHLVNRERGGSIAGIVVFSDGRSNGGTPVEDAADIAWEAGIPVYTVGLGSDKRPVNVRVVDVEAPARVYPGDHFVITGFVQAFGISNRTLEVKLYSAPLAAGKVDQANEQLEDESKVTLKDEGTVASVKFEVTPEERGKRAYMIRVQSLASDHDKRDDEKTAFVRIVERKNRVLLIAGGPTREFRFLRNQLHRDPEVTVDVLLQTAGPGVSQEGDELLFEFPKDESELFGTANEAASGGDSGYDCIVAFDPDWGQLDESQVDMLERWVAEKAGGLIVIAGPVYTPGWASRRRGDSKVDAIKALYPVSFRSWGTSRSEERFRSDEIAKLAFSREGNAADFLRLEDDDATASDRDSTRAWDDFRGVYGYYASKELKPGATSYIRLSNEGDSLADQSPIFLAGQFYGAGKVFFLASGEMWRIREVNEDYFETFYTKLIRHVSQGRLLLDSSRGVLLVSKDRALLGDSIVVRSQINDAARNPLADPEVQLDLVQPDSTRVSVTMRLMKNAAREGMYTGQFTALQEGDYRLELALPGADTEVLSREVRVRVPDREIQKPERHDALLGHLADRTDGAYYIGMPAVMGQGPAPLASVIEPQDRTIPLADVPDKEFERSLMGWLLGLICGVLCLEWLIRRLNKLA